MTQSAHKLCNFLHRYSIGYGTLQNINSPSGLNKIPGLCCSNLVMYITMRYSLILWIHHWVKMVQNRLHGKAKSDGNIQKLTLMKSDVVKTCTITAKRLYHVSGGEKLKYTHCIWRNQPGKKNASKIPRCEHQTASISRLEESRHPHPEGIQRDSFSREKGKQTLRGWRLTKRLK